MNLIRDFDFFLAQGPLFWAAAASVGLGGALLVSSIYVWARRRLGRPGTGWNPARRRRTSRPAPSPAIEVTDTGYAVGGAPRAMAPQTAPSGADREQLETLLARLREAGDRLENSLEAPNSKEFFQPVLKPARESDEIESRVGVC